MPKNPVCHQLVVIPSAVVDCILAEMAGLGYCELQQDGTIFSVGAALMRHFPGKQNELRGRPWTELRRIHFLRDLDFDEAAVAECDWAGFWTGPTAVQESGAASWLIWRSDRIPGHIVIMVRPPAEASGPSVRKSRAPREVLHAEATTSLTDRPETDAGSAAPDQR